MVDTRRINDLSRIVVDCAMKIHMELGPGLLESAYEALLENELKKRGVSVQRQIPVPLVWDGVKLPEGFRADMIVEGVLLIEIKSVEHVSPAHFKQVLTYLRLTDLRLGLLINFGEAQLKDGIRRVVNKLPES